MTRFPRRDGSSRISLIAVLLVFTAALLAVLADQARRANRSYHETTERVLLDYAKLAASNFALRSSAELELFAFAPPLEELSESIGAKGALPEPHPIEIWTDATTRLSIDLVRTAFVLTLHDDHLSISGAPLQDAARAWLADTLRSQIQEVWQDGWASAALIGTQDGDLRPIVYTVRRDSLAGHVAATGFEAKIEGLDVYFDYSLGIRPLLSPALTRGVPQDSLVSVTVTDPIGRVLFRSPRQHSSKYAAEEMMGPRFGGLTVRAVLHPQAARVLLIEGPPRTQLAFLGLLCLVGAALLGAALVLVRRESELSRLRSDFVSGVSHELRTPLAQIRLFAETLRAGRIRSEEERLRSLDILDQEARRLAHIVENALHVVRAERRPAKLVTTDTDMTTLIGEIVERFEGLVAFGRARLQTELEPGLRASVDADAVRQMITNLLDNAVKYGPEGQTIVVGLSLAGNVARITVEDEGAGIAPRDRKRVWRRFVRLPGARNSIATGTGIGLSVVRDLVHRHGGRVAIEDGRAGGARFVLLLPGAGRMP